MNLTATLRLRISLTLCLTLCLALVTCSNPDKEKFAHLERGKQYLKEKRYAEARIEFRSALQVDKRLADAQFGLGEAALALGYVQEAAEAYYEALTLDGRNLEARVRVGGLLAQYDTPDTLKEAERLAKDVIQKDDQFIDGHLLLANVRIVRKEWDDARVELDRALALNPARLETQLNVARFYEARAKAEPTKSAEWLTQAEAVFKRVIEQYPATTTARLSFGDFLFAHDRKADAEAQLLAAHKTDAQDKLVLVALRRFYESGQRYEEAETYLKKLADLDPDKTAGRAQIIDLHGRTGRVYQAVSEYQQLLKDDPKYLRGYSRLAELLLSLGDLNGATKHVETALKLSPQDTDALLMRGRLLTLGGQYREAVSDLDQVLRLEPSLPAALYYASDAHLQSNDATQARLIINRLLQFYPRNPMGMLMQARIQMHEGKAAEAEKTAGQIIENLAQLRSNETAARAAYLSPDGLPEWENKAYISRAVARIQLHDFIGARSDLQRALEIDGRNAEAHINLAVIALLDNRLDEAQRAGERAVDLAPSNLAAITTLTNVYLRQRNFQAAHAKLNELVAAQPARLQLREQQARVFIEQGDTASGERTLQQIIETDPNYLSAYFALMDFYQNSRQQTDQAIGQLNALIKRRPDNTGQLAQAYLFVGMLEETRGNRDAAARSYEQMLGYEKRSLGASIALNNLAWLYADKNLGNLDKAADHARAAINITPEAGYYDTLGYVYYKKRQYEVAIEQFNRAIDRRANQPNYYLHLARALRDNGDTQRARAAYEKALQLGGAGFPELAQARQELGALRKS